MSLKLGNKVIDCESLTISLNLDTLLITAIDKLLTRNKIDQLSLKSLKMLGKIRSEAVSGMIIKTVKAGLEV